MMTVIEAQRILNNNDRGKVYNIKEVKAYLKQYYELLKIHEDHPIEKPLINLHNR